MSSANRILAALLPPTVALTLARRLLKSAGVGHGGIVAKSGLAAMRHTLALTGAGDAPVLFDVGANIGEWTLAAKAGWPAANIHAFEPSQAHLQRMRAAIGGLDKVTVVASALGREAGAATLYKDREITGLASMTRRDLDHAGISMDAEETIAVTTLDAYCEEHSIEAIDYLKIDVEGHGLDVLQGGAAMLARRAIGAVQFEFGGCNIDTRTFLRDFFKLFDKHGYRLHICGPTGRLHPLRRYNEFNEQFSTTNYVAVRH